MEAATRIFVARASVTGNDDASASGISCNSNDSACEFLKLIASPFASELGTRAFLASLVTSTALTGGIALVFCFLRPYNNVVYAPRAKHADSKHAPPPVSKGLFGWIPPLIRTKEEELVEKVGLDAALFLRFTRMLRTIFALLSVIGCGILIPVNLLAASYGDGASFFLRLTPQYMYGSQAFWAYVVLAYLLTGIILFFLWTNYRAVLRLRRAYFDSPEYQRSLHARTLLLTDIPMELRSDEGIVKITEDVKANESIPRAAIARNVKDLPDLVDEHERVVRALEGHLAKYLKNPDKIPPNRPTCKVNENDKNYTKGQKVDAIEYLTFRIKELEQEIKEVRESVDKRNALSYGFASYPTIAEAHSVAYVARKGGPKKTIIRLAPKPNDLVWKNLPMLKKDRQWQNFINNLWVALLTVFWVVPNVLIAVFLSNLTHLGLVWPAFMTSLEAHKNSWAIVQGVVSPAITTAFYYYLPAIFRKLCVNAGDVSKTSRERHVMHKLYSFFVFNNLIVFSIFSSIFGYVAAVINDSKNGGGVWQALENQHPLNDIVLTLCQVSPYWISWLLQRNIGTAIDLSQAVTLIWGAFSRHFLAPTPRELIEMSAPQPFDYASYYNYFLFYSTVGLCIGVLQPLALPVTALYFFLDSFLKKYLILYVFITKYESGGMFWRTLYNRMLVCTFLGNVVIALLVCTQGAGQGANWVMLAAMAPLPFVIIGFKIYCARTFDDPIHYFQKGKALRDSASLADGEEVHKKRRGDRVGVRFGHPVLYKPLITPMVSAKSQHLLKQVYSGRLSADDNITAAGYSDVYMDAMDAQKPGKSAAINATPSPFEFVPDHQLDFEHYKNRPEFRDEAGGDGELFGYARDIVRPGTPGSWTTMTRTATMDSSNFDTYSGRYSRSESRDAYYNRSRSGSGDSERTRVGGVGGGQETEYPRGYHQTPSTLRDHSPDTFMESHRPYASGELRPKESREGLVGSAARMGRSPPPQLPTPYAPAPGGYGLIQTPGSTPGESAGGDDRTSYDFFRRGRGL
ncbi:hypothetical protein M433DRAFT_60773 [Acidomyces richmondensis BFW]|nr:MAG: hypothetical protein FE78DRAFT_136396 [Acidomyces sp. 'richmondensis']KYG48593.1 hypothetical protein M433DRAFT_60773 [Acidomyces richmondensis BFW]